MYFRSCLAVTLALAFASPAPASAQESTPLESSVYTAVLLPFSLVYVPAASASNLVKASIGDRKRWTVKAVRPQGEKTAVELRSEDQQLKLDMLVDAKVARAHRLQVNDDIGIEAIGNTGHAVKKGTATIGLLAEPGSGMAHSKVRN